MQKKNSKTADAIKNLLDLVELFTKEPAKNPKTIEWQEKLKKSLQLVYDTTWQDL